MRSVLSIVALLAIAFNVSAQDWVKAEGISTQMSVTSIQENDGKLVAFGQKQWRENMNFFSEPCAYSSTDNGATWTLMDVIYNGNSTANTLLFTDGRIITSGRDGDVQLDWVGAVKYSDDNGYTWIQVTTIPSDNSITKIQKYDGKLYAFGQKQWREGFAFYSEPRSYVSEDNGATWAPFVTITPALSTSNSLLMNNGRILTSGREGQTQVEWIGAVYYTDDNGATWTKAQGLPTDMAVTEIIVCGEKLIAGGQRQWMENFVVYSEPLLFVSEDNGTTWTKFIPVTKELSSVLPVFLNDGRLMVAGRLGATQMDWYGALFYANL